jgi:hypothetical protein
VFDLVELLFDFAGVVWGAVAELLQLLFDLAGAVWGRVRRWFRR